MVIEAPLLYRPTDTETLAEKRPSPEDWEVLAALQEFGTPKEISPDWAIFNTSFISAPVELQGTILLSRAVHRRNIREGEPDRNVLHVSVLDQSGKPRERLPDLSLPIDEKAVNWEDARVGPDRTLGFTVVLHEGDKYHPHPALVKVGIENGHLEVVDEPQIFEDIRGKNVVPLEDGFIYRPDGALHQLHYLDAQGGWQEIIIDFSQFKKNEWISSKMGAVARPIELGNGHKLLLIHGVRENGRGIDGTIKDNIYAIGIAVLDDEWNVLAVDKEPLLQRKDFLENLDPKHDLDHTKEVVYLCDFMESGDQLILPVNVGDIMTVFKHIKTSDLKARAESLL